MPPKTERLELRLEGETIEQVDGWCERQDDSPSRSEGIRRLLQIALESHTKEGLHLSRKERLNTWLLSEILKNQVSPPKSQFDKDHILKDVKIIHEAIYGGHFWALNWEMVGVMHDETDDPKIVRSVVNILDTWEFIERAYDSFSQPEKAIIEEYAGFRGRSPKFMGFDGNNEGEYMSIARFLVEQLNRFQHFKGRDFNSHLPTAERYTLMSEAFEPMRTSLIGRGLTPDQVIQLLKIDG